MSARAEFLPEVYGDIDAASRWYEARIPGLGDRFEDAVFDAIRVIADNPRIDRPASGEFRRRPLRGFPFGIYYRETSATVVIAGIFHFARDPENISNALGHRRLGSPGRRPDEPR